jgi:hypothetical protein
VPDDLGNSLARHPITGLPAYIASRACVVTVHLQWYT